MVSANDRPLFRGDDLSWGPWKYVVFPETYSAGKADGALVGIFTERNQKIPGWRSFELE